MLGGLFSRQNRHPQVPPPPKVIEPPVIPSQEKRQEKERRWVESISSRNLSKRAGQSAASHPPLPAPVEFIKKDQPASGGLSGGKTGILDRWSTSHKRGSTAGSTSNASAALTPDNRSLRTTRSASTLASKIGIGRRSRERERQKSSSSSLLSSHTAVPPSSSYAASAIPRTPPLLQLGGEGDATFVHVPQFSPSSALLLAPSSSSSSSSTSTYFSSHAHTHGSYLSPSSSRHTSSSRAGHAGHTAPTSQQSHGPHGSTNAQSRMSKLETTKTLAARLQELEHANNVGLLDDEEYRVLRQNLFEKNVSSEYGIESTSLPSYHSANRLQEYPHHVSSTSKVNPPVTGSLLGLPRLNMALGDTREPYVPDVPPAPNLDISDVPPPQESSTSIHSKTSRFSLRSARSHLTTRSSISQMSRVFRRGGSSAPASTSISHDRSNRASHIYREDDQHIPPLPNAVPIHQEHNITSGDSTSSKNIPVGIGRRLTKKGSIPSDWKQLQQLHFMETEREAAKFHSASKNNRDNERGSVLLDDLHAAHEGNYAKSESRYRTMRRQSLSVQEQGSLAYSKSDYRNNDSAPSSSSDKAMIASSNRPIASIGRADEAIADGTFNHTLAHNFTSTATCASMITVQPGDENLDSVGLKQAIATLREENNRLLSQFDDLEGKLHEKYGDPDIDAMRAPAQRRRESISLHSTSGRRMSTSSSIFSSQGRNSMIGYPKDAGSLAPTSPLSRRPSKTSSIASSSMRRGLNSSGSTHPGTMDTWLTSRPPSTVEEELLFTTGTPEGGTECLQSLASSNPHFEKEYRDLQERKSNIQEKYTARLEYLEARLQGQLNKEKLRR